MNMPAAATVAASAPAVDLDAYFTRIGYFGPRTPTLATLRAVHALHPAAIVFEAIDVLLDRGVDLSPDAVDAKLIGARRGGYCFEQNGLFRRVLRTLGFSVEGLAARVRWLLPADAPPTPTTHLVLRVMLDGVPWLVDVGFGGCVPTAPLRLDTDAIQQTPHEPYRLRPLARGWLLEVQLGTQWTPVYELLPEPQLDIDDQLRNWYTSTHPNSPFRNLLIVARATAGARHALRDNRYTLRRPGAEPEHRLLDADGIERLLTECFELPVPPDWRPLIERAARGTT